MLDFYGAAGKAMGAVRVGLKTYTLSELSALAKDKASKAIDSGNADAAKQVLGAAASRPRARAGPRRPARRPR